MCASIIVLAACGSGGDSSDASTMPSSDPTTTTEATQETVDETTTTTTTAAPAVDDDPGPTVGQVAMSGTDLLVIGPIGDVVDTIGITDGVVTRCPPGRDSEGSISIVVRFDTGAVLVNINEITLSHHSVRVYEEGVGLFEVEATSSLNRSQWFDDDGVEVEGPLLVVDDERISASATLTVDGFDETRNIEFDLPIPDEIADSLDCAL